MKELLNQPEYVHVLINPFLTHALPLAALGLLVALIFRSDAAVRLALVCVLLSAAFVWPAVHYGRLGFDRIQAMSDSAGTDWLEIHRHRAEETFFVFYAAAAVALVALLVPLVWPKKNLLLAWLTLIVSGAACAVALYIAYPGGRIKHREFRHDQPSATELQKAHAEEADQH